MLLSIVMVLVVLFNVYSGYHQGFINKFVNLLSYLLAGWVASYFTHPISDWLLIEQPQLDMPMVNALLAILLFIMTFLIVRKIGNHFNILGQLPGIHFLNALGGSVIGLIIGYLICLLVIKLGLAFDNQWFPLQYDQSNIAQMMVQHSNDLVNFFNLRRW